MAVSITWGSFQSLIQLSVGLNAAFAAFGSYTGTDVQKEKYRLERIRRAVTGGAVIPPQGDNDLGGLARIILLEGVCETLSTSYLEFIGGKFKTLCVCAASLGILMIIYSSYFANLSIGFFNRDLSIMLVGPFYYGLFRLGVLKVRLYKDVTREVDAIERQVITQLGGRVP